MAYWLWSFDGVEKNASKTSLASLEMLFIIPDLVAIEVVDERLECDSASCSVGQVSSADSSVDRNLVAAAFDKVSEEPYPAETADEESFPDPVAACLDWKEDLVQIHQDAVAA